MASRWAPALAVVGATGAVGSAILELLSTRRDVYGDVRLLASPRSAGRTIAVRGTDVEVAAPAPGAFDGVDIAMFAVPDAVAARWAPVAAERGAAVVDGSGAFRMRRDVPLVVPEVNPEAVRERPRGVVAGPGGATMAVIVALGALHRTYGLREVVVASYEAASGEGRDGVDTLHAQLEKVGGDRALGNRAGDVRGVVGDPGPFPVPLAMNVVPWTGGPAEGGWTTRELGVRVETRKVLGLPGLKVSATGVRVPVVTGHSAAVHAVFERPVDRREAQDVLARSPGVVLADDPEALEFPTPSDVIGTDPVWAGRVRVSPDDPHALDLFLSGDNLRVGSALNTVQIGELIAAELGA
ncbi:aspartate-semialdehyde dehydrogenase [Actinomadura sp. WMMB 499]|uniref:aspartate-semialdehyde dehydrogenase n=1 Tax=Actinomadura sp. WMMB 499 TaxID=1219491 RepID=UPI00124921A9|nr:aspartate-semialdehyde dehydrogenase [Actinomadura sp. WMMB 499]QFG23260.1 aspartate-semialdehyde dehydrogenase [Actinomadura sp. WMMB 499]